MSSTFGMLILTQAMRSQIVDAAAVVRGTVRGAVRGAVRGRTEGIVG
jgi:hypothetical protein